MAASLPPIPPSLLKSLQHYIKTAVEHDKREPIVAYYCRMYALQKGMELDKSSPEAKKFLYALMDLLEKGKSELKLQEAMQSETVGQAHVENYALKMFAFADTEDREQRHTKNVVKSFYTAGLLFDVLSVFGETPDEIEKYKKYAKYKAAYIHRCLKEGLTPIPGPVDEEGQDIGFGDLVIRQPGADGGASLRQNPSSQQPPAASSSYQLPASSSYHQFNTSQPPLHSTTRPQHNPSQTMNSAVPLSDAGIEFEVDWAKATKYTKFATSSLAYQDREAAIDYLQKALNLLAVGHE